MYPRRLARGKEGRTRAAEQRDAAGDDIVHRRIVDRDRDIASGQRVVDRDLRPAVAERISDDPAEEYADDADDRSLDDEDAAHRHLAHAERLHDRDVLPFL